MDKAATKDESDMGVRSLSARLSRFAADRLSEAERNVLKVVLLRAMDPLDRMCWRNPEQVLNAQEVQELEGIVAITHRDS